MGARGIQERIRSCDEIPITLLFGNINWKLIMTKLDKIREEFEKKYKVLFNLSKKQGFGGEYYEHPHIESMWYGYYGALKDRPEIFDEDENMAGAIMISAQEDSNAI